MNTSFEPGKILDRAFLIGERIYLRPLELEDVNDRYLQWVNDPEVVLGRIENEICLLPFAFRLFSSVNNMSELMSWADIAISAGRSTCWELAYMGIPSIILVLAENQRHNAEKLDSAGVVCNLGGYEKASKEQIGLALRNIMLDKDVRARLSMRGQELVDGAGAERTVTLVTLGQIRLRPVQEEDCELLWKWANDPDLRQLAFNSAPIPWGDHKIWFSKKLIDPNCFHFIALTDQDKPIGQIWFDIDDCVAEVKKILRQVG